MLKQNHVKNVIDSVNEEQTPLAFRQDNILHFIDLVQALIAPFWSLRHVMRHFGQPHHIRSSLVFPVVVVLTNVRHV